MFHYETVAPRTLAVLKQLMAIEALTDFALVGGTALALRYGHRTSVDLDLFMDGEMDREVIIGVLTEAFGSEFTYRDDQVGKWAIFGFIGDVKIDIVRFPHQRIGNLEENDGLRLYSDEDIGPMKIEAILHRAQKKDFWDIDELLRARGLQVLMDDHRRKYPRNTIAISIPRALTYFQDAEDSPDPVSLKGQTWEAVKISIGSMVNRYL